MIYDFALLPHTPASLINAEGSSKNLTSTIPAANSKYSDASVDK